MLENDKYVIIAALFLRAGKVSKGYKLEIALKTDQKGPIIRGRMLGGTRNILHCKPQKDSIRIEAYQFDDDGHIRYDNEGREMKVKATILSVGDVEFDGIKFANIDVEAVFTALFDSAGKLL